MDPLTSEPIAIPPPVPIAQSLMVMFSDGRFTRNPSASFPDLMEMSSSKQEMVQREILTSRLESTSMPSELGIYTVARMLRLSATTFWQYRRCRHQTACFCRRRPVMRTLRQLLKQINRGRPRRGTALVPAAFVEMFDATAALVSAGTELVPPRRPRRLKPLLCIHKSPEPSIVPSPVTSTLVILSKLRNALVHVRSTPSQRVKICG